ncbi:hypothetical protein CJF31_00001589 [Rutstroemia sp. NJR-2017a BVV2]|nr:hypothetical protein CJF31_00001589 [Rutstroemia sp. NJR-2017a BVV2]
MPQDEDCPTNPAGSPADIDPELDPFDKAELRCKNFNPLMLELETSIGNLPASKERAKMIFVAGVLRDKYHRAVKKSPSRRPEDRAAYPTCHTQVEELFRKALSKRPWEPKKRLMSNNDENGMTEGQPSRKRRKTEALPATGATKLKTMSSTKLLEENLHPWRVGSWTEIPNSGMLWRVWDKRSACRIDDSRVGFLAGSPDYCLGLSEDRSVSLKNHANWGCRNPSPFISTTSSFAEIVDHRVPQLKKRQGKYKGQLINIKLTLINVRARIAAKMPVLKMTTELDHYKVQTPYGNFRNYLNSFFENEYLCPFVIPAAEIVGTFTWSSVEQWAKDNNAPLERWAKVIGKKAFNEHEKARQPLSLSYPVTAVVMATAVHAADM